MTFHAKGNYIAYDPRSNAMVFSIRDSTESMFQGAETFTIRDVAVMKHIVKALGYNNPAQMTGERGRPTDIRIEIKITHH